MKTRLYRRDAKQPRALRADCLRAFWAVHNTRDLCVRSAPTKLITLFTYFITNSHCWLQHSNLCYSAHLRSLCRGLSNINNCSINHISLSFYENIHDKRPMKTGCGKMFGRCLESLHKKHEILPHSRMDPIKTVKYNTQVHITSFINHCAGEKIVSNLAGQNKSDMSRLCSIVM